MNRLTTSPSQNTGIEMPIRASDHQERIRDRPAEDGCGEPDAECEKTTQMTAAPKTSESVTGAALMISGITFVPRSVRDQVAA